MKIVKKSHLVGILMWLSLMTSCNYLDVNDYMRDLTPLDSIFARQEYLQRYLWGGAALLPTPGDLYSNSYGPYGTAVDETLMSWRAAQYAGTYLYAGEIDPFAANNHYNVWGKYYKGIRKCNTIFARIDECKDITPIRKRDIMGLTHYLRASFYFYLLELYGPVPIVPEKPMNVDDETENLSFPRNTYDECVNYICEDLEKAYALMDEKRPSSEFFRPSKHAAAALMARVRLMAASPWYNGNPYYSDWQTADGKHFISQTADPQKWAKAAAVAKRIIESGIYNLHTVPSDDTTPKFPDNVSKQEFPDGVGGIDPFHSYKDMFDGEALDVRNPEIILAGTLSGNVTNIAFPLHMGGWNGLGVTQKLIDAYRMKDGSDYVNANNFYEPIGSDSTFSGYVLKGTAPKMYLDREMRFYASIGFCECFWPGTSLPADKKDFNGRRNQTITYYKDGNTPYRDNPEDVNRTGYTMKKYIHPEDNYWSEGSIKGKTYPIMRYAEILLNYVEALSEIQGQAAYSETVNADDKTYTVSHDPAEIMKYFNMIRFRSGLPGINLAQASNQKEMRELIKRERMTEFAHEGRRYHDLRRWGIAEREENMPVQGMDVTQKKADRKAFFTVVNIFHKYAIREFDKKMYFWPIPREVMNKNGKLIQNYGWDGYHGW